MHEKALAGSAREAFLGINDEVDAASATRSDSHRNIDEDVSTPSAVRRKLHYFTAAFGRLCTQAIPIIGASHSA